MTTAKHAIALYYYGIGGRAMAARLILNHAGVEFTDVRFADGAEVEKAFAETPARYPLGTVPVLEVDGHVISQSNAILVAASKLAGMWPDDLIASAYFTEIQFNLEDAGTELFKTFGKTGEDLQKSREEWRDVTAVKFVNRIEAIIEKLSPAGPFALGEKPSGIDFAITMFFSFFVGGTIDHIPADIYSRTPRIKSLVDGVYGLDSVTAYKAAHPMF